MKVVHESLVHESLVRDNERNKKVETMKKIMERLECIETLQN